VSNLQKHTIIGDNPTWQRAHPVLLHLFCQGMLTVDKKWLLRYAMLSIVMSPFMFLLGSVTKSIHIVVLVACWWFLKEYISEYGLLHLFLLAIGFIAILYKILYDVLVVFLLDVLLIVTGGACLRWLCDGYLAGAVFRQKMMMEGPVADFIAPIAASVPHENFGRYNEIMDLYLDLNRSGNEEKLSLLLDAYERD
jgi:hypothetical protein